MQKYKNAFFNLNVLAFLHQNRLNYNENKQAYLM